MSNAKYLVFWSLLIIGCTQSNSDEHDEFKTVTVEESNIFIDSEISKAIVFPSFLRTTFNYFLLYEAKTKKIFKFNYKGEQSLWFGGKGRGPGEFLSLTNYWVLEDYYLLYDYNGAKMILYDFDGSLIKEYSVDSNNLSANVEVLSKNKFVSSAKGKQGSLLKISDIKNNKTAYIGEAVAGANETSNEKIRQIIKGDGVPNYMQNRVLFDVNESGIFSFQSTNALLQKFNKNGRLLWEKDLKIPPVEGVYENYLKKNQKKKYIYSLTYAIGVHAVENGIAILLNTPEDNPTTVAWISNDGHNTRVVEYPKINNSTSIPLRFRVAPEHNIIFFVNSLEGKIFRATWPIKRGK